MTPQEGRNKGKGIETPLFRQDSQVGFFSTCYTNDLIGISNFCSTTVTNNTTGGQKRREGVETLRCLDPGMFFLFGFFTFYTNDFIDISFSSTVTSDATGGQKRGEGLETLHTCLERLVSLFMYLFTCYTDLFYRHILLVINPGKRHQL
jgi:hypothetical protein